MTEVIGKLKAVTALAEEHQAFAFAEMLSLAVPNMPMQGVIKMSMGKHGLIEFHMVYQRTGVIRVSIAYGGNGRVYTFQHGEMRTALECGVYTLTLAQEVMVVHNAIKAITGAVEE